jgi:HEAT repeat protein
MKAVNAHVRGMKRSGRRALLLTVAMVALALPVMGQTAPDKQGATDKAAAARQDTSPPDETNAPDVTLPATSTPEERNRRAWAILTDAAGDIKHTQTRLQALAALGLLRSPRSSKMIADAMLDPDVDIRTAAALAAGETKDRNLTTNLRNLLDDKEPQVDFVAAMTLWKMNDKSGEDVLMSVVAGDRSTNPTLMHGTEHKINKDLHDPAMLAKMGAMQGAIMLLGPFGYGITAFQFIHQGGGDLARASAIEQLSQEKIEPVHKEVLDALADKDQVVRVAALKGLMDYHDSATSLAIYKLFADTKYPVRLTAAAAYLRTTGTPGPPITWAAQVRSVQARTKQ